MKGTTKQKTRQDVSLSLLNGFQAETALRQTLEQPRISHSNPNALTGVVPKPRLLPAMESKESFFYEKMSIPELCQMIQAAEKKRLLPQEVAKARENICSKLEFAQEVLLQDDGYIESLASQFPLCADFLRHFYSNRNDLQEVSSLVKTVQPTKDEAGMRRIQWNKEQRIAKRDQSIADFDATIAALNAKYEHDIAQVAEDGHKLLSSNEADMDSRLKTLAENPEVMLHSSPAAIVELQDFMDFVPSAPSESLEAARRVFQPELFANESGEAEGGELEEQKKTMTAKKQGIESPPSLPLQCRRLSYIEDLGRALERVESERMEKVNSGLEKLINSLLDLALEKREVVVEMVQDVAAGLNASAVDSRLANAELIHRLQLSEMERQKRHRELFDTVTSQWRQYRHEYSLDTYKKRLVDRSFLSSITSRSALMADFCSAESKLEQLIMDQLAGIASLSIAGLTSDLATQWKEALETSRNRVQNLSRKYISELKTDDANSEAKVALELQRLREELRSFAHVSHDQIDADIESHCGPLVVRRRVESAAYIRMFEEKTTDAVQRLDRHLLNLPTSITTVMYDASNFVSDARSKFDTQTIEARDHVQQKRQETYQKEVAAENALQEELGKLAIASSETKIDEVFRSVLAALDDVRDQYDMSYRDVSSTVTEQAYNVRQCGTELREKMFEYMGLVDAEEYVKKIEKEEEEKQAAEAAEKLRLEEEAAKNAKGAKGKPAPAPAKGAPAPVAEAPAPPAEPQPTAADKARAMLATLEQISTTSGKKLAAVRPVSAMCFASAAAEPGAADAAASAQDVAVAPATPAAEDSPIEGLSLEDTQQLKSDFETDLKLFLRLEDDDADSVRRVLRQKLVDYWDNSVSSALAQYDADFTQLRQDLSAALRKQLKAYDARRANLEVDARERRVRQISKHSRDLQRHLSSCQEKTAKTASKCEADLRKLEAMLSELKQQQVSRSESLSSVSQSSKCDKIRTEAATAASMLLEDCNRMLNDCKAKLESSQLELENMNSRFFESLKPIQEGGEYSPEERQSVQVQLETFASQWEKETLSIIAQYDAFVQRASSDSEQSVHQVSAECDVHKEDLKLIESLSFITLILRGKVKGEYSASDSAHAEIADLLKQLDALCDGFYDSKKNDSDNGGQNASVEAAEKCVKLLELLRRRVYSRAKNLAALRPSSSSLVLPLIPRDLLERLFDVFNDHSHIPTSSDPASPSPFKPDSSFDSLKSMLERIADLRANAMVEMKQHLSAYYTSLQSKGNRAITRQSQIPASLDEHVAKLEASLEDISEQTTFFHATSLAEFRIQVARVREVVLNTPAIVFGGAKEAAVAKVSKSRKTVEADYESNALMLHSEKKEHNSRLKPSMAAPSVWGKLTDLDQAEQSRTQQAITTVRRTADSLKKIETDSAQRLIRHLHILSLVLLTFFDSMVLPEDLVPGVTAVVVGQHRSLKSLMISQLKASSVAAAAEAAAAAPPVAADPKKPQPKGAAAPPPAAANPDAVPTATFSGMPLAELTPDFAINNGISSAEVLHATPRSSAEEAAAAAAAAAPTPAVPLPKGAPPPPVQPAAPAVITHTPKLVSIRPSDEHKSMFTARNQVYVKYRAAYMDRVNKIESDRVHREAVETKWLAVWNSMVQKLKPSGL